MIDLGVWLGITVIGAVLLIIGFALGHTMGFDDGWEVGWRAARSVYDADYVPPPDAPEFPHR